MQTYQELKSLTKKELLLALHEAREELLKRKITVKTKHEKDSSGVLKLKRYIARLLTALRQVEIEDMIDASTKID